MKNLKILIVEDEWLTAQFLEDILIELGYLDIKIVQNANDAVKLTKENRFDVTFMDINIEGSIDGIQCSMLLNSIYPLPTVFISAYSDEETILNASDTNIYGYIVKPFNKLDVDIALKIVQRRVKKDTSISNIQHIVKLKNNYQFNRANLSLQVNNEDIKLTKKERDANSRNKCNFHLN